MESRRVVLKSVVSRPTDHNNVDHYFLFDDLMAIVSGLDRDNNQNQQFEIIYSYINNQ
jgi:hypothetical protein